MLVCGLSHSLCVVSLCRFMVSLCDILPCVCGSVSVCGLCIGVWSMYNLSSCYLCDELSQLKMFSSCATCLSVKFLSSISFLNTCQLFSLSACTVSQTSTNVLLDPGRMCTTVVTVVDLSGMRSRMCMRSFVKSVAY